jgi:hypothetical protein
LYHLVKVVRCGGSTLTGDGPMKTYFFLQVHMTKFELIWMSIQLFLFVVMFAGTCDTILRLVDMRFQHDEDMERIRRVPADKLIPDWVDTESKPPLPAWLTNIGRKP